MPRLGLGRDPARTPMQWDASLHAGFCPPTVEPWLPIAPDYQQVNVAMEREEQPSMLTLTQALLTLRRSRAALHRGSYHSLESDSEHCFVYLRQFDNERLVIALNFSEKPQLVRVAELGEGQMLLSTSPNRARSVNLSALQLQRHEGCIIELLDGE